MYIVLIIFAVLGAVIIVSILWSIRCQKRRDHAFIDSLKKQADVLILNVTMLHETVYISDGEVRGGDQWKDYEILISEGFLIFPSRTPAALYNVNLKPHGVPGISWSIKIDRMAIINENSLQIDCQLPCDDFTFSRITFQGILGEPHRHDVIKKLGIDLSPE